MSYNPISKVVLSDTFTDTNGTSIASHTPDTVPKAGTWTQTVPTAFYIQNNSLQPNRKIDSDIAYIDSGMVNYSLTCTITPFHDSTTVKATCCLLWNYVDASNFNYCNFDSSLNKLEFYQCVSGTHTLLMTITTAALTAKGVGFATGVPTNVRIDQNGFDVTFWVGGQEIQIYTLLSTANISSKVGVRNGQGGTPSGRPAWTNFKVQEYLGSKYNWPKFTKLSVASPIIALGSAGTWDSADINDPSVIYNPANSSYNIIYSGYKTTDNLSFQSAGLASAPAITGPWTKYNAGVAPVIQGTASRIHNGGVCYKNGVFYYVYCVNNYFSLQTSTDLINWSAPTNNVIGPTTATFDAAGVYDSFLRLRQDGVTFELWYVGGTNPRALGFATSTDCITWKKSPLNPVIGQQLWANQTTTLGEPSVFVPAGKEGMEYLISFDAGRNGSTGNRFVTQALTVDGMNTWSYRMIASERGTGWQSAQNFDSHIYFENQKMYLFHGGADIAGPTLDINIQIGITVADWPYESFNRNTPALVANRTAVT